MIESEIIFKGKDMQNKWNFFNYVLVVVLIILLVVIGVIWVSGQKADQNLSNKQTSQTIDLPLEKEIDQPDTGVKNKNETVKKIDDTEKKEEDVKKDDKDENEDSDKDQDDSDVKDNSQDESDDLDEDKDGEKSGTTKILTGILEEAEEENEYGGNYKIKLSGNSEYTYLSLSESMVDDGMVGEKVELEVQYQDDGTFVIVGGPDMAN